MKQTIIAAQLAFLFPATATREDCIAAINEHFSKGNAAWPKAEAAPITGSASAAGGDNTTAAPAPAGVQVDSRGLPWDQRIHSNPPKTSEKDGIWRKRRGVDDATVAAVEKELLAMLQANAAAAPTGAAPAAVSATTPQQHAAQAWGMVPPGCPIEPQKWAMIQANQTVQLSPAEAEWMRQYSAQTMQQSASAAFQGTHAHGVNDPGHTHSIATPAHTHAVNTDAAAAFGHPATVQQTVAPTGAVNDPMAMFGGMQPAAPARVCPFHSFEALRDYILANAQHAGNPAGKLSPVVLMPAMQALGVPNGNMQLLQNMPNLFDAVASKVDELMAA